MILSYFEEKMTNLKYPISLHKLTRILSNKQRLQGIDDRCAHIMPLLSEQGRKRLLFELKHEAKLAKMSTEIHILYQFAILNFNIDKPERGDIFASNSLNTFNIEVYQPDVSRSKILREIERGATVRFYESVQGRETISRGYTTPINPERLLREIVSESIKKKRARAQLSKNNKAINILCVDLSDRSLTERLHLIDLDVLKYFDLSDFKTLLDDWDALNGFILSMWMNDLLTEKIGILINRDLDKEHLSILNRVISLLMVV